MPQLILEYSNNIIEKNCFLDLLQNINNYLAKTLPTDLSSCKSRAIEHAVYCVGDGNYNHAFVHINLKIMRGRSIEKLNEIGLKLQEILSQCFHESIEKLNLQVTLEIEELAKTYFKN